ncbi:hypothetical protein [Nocardia brasiliensis]
MNFRRRPIQVRQEKRRMALSIAMGAAIVLPGALVVTGQGLPTAAAAERCDATVPGVQVHLYTEPDFLGDYDAYRMCENSSSTSLESSSISLVSLESSDSTPQRDRTSSWKAVWAPEFHRAVCLYNYVDGVDHAAMLSRLHRERRPEDRNSRTEQDGNLHTDQDGGSPNAGERADVIAFC